jgi:hypothetical protein
MNLDEVEIDKRYACDHDDGKQYYATVLGKNDRWVLVTLDDRVGNEGEEVHALGTLGPRWVEPKQLHKF